MITDGTCAMLTKERGHRPLPRPPDPASAARSEAGAAWLDRQRAESDIGPALPAGCLDIETVFSFTA
jgi:hypothetical protein